MAECPSCRRPVAVARERCVYCGEPLPGHIVEELKPSPDREPAHPWSLPRAAAPPAPDRSLLVLDLDAATTVELGAALELSAYEADLLARRGGFLLHRILRPEAAETERERLAAAGLRVEVVPESETRVPPCRAVGGERGQGSLTFRTDEGAITLRGEDLLLVVRGPIARQYQPSYRGRRVETASLDEGFRVHLHRLANPRPVEIDSSNFEFGASASGSSRLQLEYWLDEIGEGVPLDNEFRRLPPALGVAEPEPTQGPLAAASALGRARRRDSRREGESVVLDNAAQFRFYSAWRAALERRRSGRLPAPMGG
jgi:hypothetical protein